MASLTTFLAVIVSIYAGARGGLECGFVILYLFPKLVAARRRGDIEALPVPELLARLTIGLFGVGLGLGLVSWVMPHRIGGYLAFVGIVMVAGTVSLGRKSRQEVYRRLLEK